MIGLDLSIMQCALAALTWRALWRLVLLVASYFRARVVCWMPELVVLMKFYVCSRRVYVYCGIVLLVFNFLW
jgi:hypothetical protein